MKLESSYNYFRGMFSAEHLKSTVIGKNVELTPQEELLVDDALSVKKYRFQEVGFHSVARGLTPNERIGLTLFVGLVCRIDDLIDDHAFPRFATPKELENHLNTRTHVLSDNTQITIEGYTKEVLRHFNSDKRQLITNYLASALEAQVKHNGTVGTYGYQEAREYRMITSSGFARTALQLGGIEGEELERRSGEAMFVWQEIDDATDLLPDLRSNRMNLIIGRARDFGEISTLIHAAERFSDDHQTAKGLRRITSTISYLHHTATALRAMPRTTESFLLEFDTSMKQSSGVYKTVLQGIRRLSKTFL